MNYASLISTFDLFASCYIYGCLTYVAILFLLHVHRSLSVPPDQANESFEPDFSTQVQVKDIFDPASESILEPVYVNFEVMTIRELRTYIKENQLHQQVRDCLNKTVSNARKDELIIALS